MLNEHHKLNDKGELLGLYTVDVNKGSFDHGDFWSRIDQIIYEYYKLHPLEMELLIAENKQIIQDEITNKYGITNKDHLGWGMHMRVPVGLLKALETYCPEFFTDKKYYHKFCERYQALRAFDKNR